MKGKNKLNQSKGGEGMNKQPLPVVYIIGVLKVESPRLFHNLARVNSGQLCLKSVVEL